MASRSSSVRGLFLSSNSLSHRICCANSGVMGSPAPPRPACASEGLGVTIPEGVCPGVQPADGVAPGVIMAPAFGVCPGVTPA